MPSVSGLSKKHRIEARDRAVHAAMLALRNAPKVHYTQGARRWDGINLDFNARMGEYPKYADCSALATWCLWNGLHIPFGVRDTVNGANWQGGYTGTMLSHGKRVVHTANVQRGDCVIYGVPGTTGKHVAIVVGRRKSDGKIMCVSHGSEGGPYYVPWDYRSDTIEFRRYI